MRAVIYGVKSSPDEKESVADQQHQATEAAEREDREVVATFGEQNASGYRRERGPELEAAMRAARTLAEQDGEAELWVFHSSRLARGDGRKGKRSMQLVVAQLLYEDVIVRSVSDPEMVDPMLTGIGSKIGNQYSKDIGTHTKRGLRQRKEAGKPVGAVPFGFMVEVTVEGGKPVSRRLIDPITGPLRAQALERLADGASPGSVARWLNAQGVKTRRGKSWTPRAMRQVAESDVHEGGNGYPAIVTPELAQRARESLQRLDPVAVQRRTGGRQPRDPAFILRAIASCTCGAPLYTTRKYLGGERSYVCREHVQSSGLCHAKPIPAELLERHVLDHLARFTDDVESWIAGLLAERDGALKARESGLDQERAALAALDRQRADRMAELEAIGVTKVGLELIERMDAKRKSQAETIADAEAMVAEFATTPNVNAALDAYSELLDLINGRVGKAQGAQELNEALGGLLVGLWCQIDQDILRVEFELHTANSGEFVLPDGRLDFERAGQQPPLVGLLPAGPNGEPIPRCMSRSRRARPARARRRA
jgi:DNA invertase Pin-like site-specific DNA recombinase